MISQTPLASMVSNEDAVARLQRFAKQFWQPGPKPRFALLGPASVGKTTFARAYGAEIDVPFVELQPHSILKVDNVYDCVVNECGRQVAPECVVFIDEVHALTSRITAGLLKAIEPKDGILTTERKRNLNCCNVSWVVATTSVGELSGPFVSRFSHIQLDCYTRREISQIVGMNYPRFNPGLCTEIARCSGMVPREALLFAGEVQAEADLTGEELAEIIKIVAEQNDIDEFGMTEQRVNTLKALGFGPRALACLCADVGVESKEMTRFILPPLMARTEERPVPLVTTSSRGKCITPAGLRELTKRKIKHLGTEAMPLSIQDRYERQENEDN